MTKSAFAAHSRIRNVVLCSVVTFGLAACGSGGGSGSSAAASAPSGSIPSLVQPNIGVVARSPEVATTTPTTTTPASGSTVASNPSPPAQPTSSTGSATLDWMPPTENVDGSILTNLAGYTVYYGTSAGNLTQSVKITNPGLTAYTMTNLPSGTWYFAVTAYSSAGVESSRTATVSTRI
jgi:hypothetical protein